MHGVVLDLKQWKDGRFMVSRVEGRRAQVRLVATDNAAAGGDSMYVVDLYENNKLIQTRPLPGHNRHYAEDVAENWETGIIQLLTE